MATVNNTTVQQIRVWDYAIYAGIRYEQLPPVGEDKGLRAYAQLQIGGVYDVMGLSGASSGIQNTGVDFAMRFVPGFEAWVSPSSPSILDFRWSTSRFGTASLSGTPYLG